jgi:4-azaleucine resistance transporter AzlC
LTKQVPNPNEPRWQTNLKTAMPLNISYVPIGIACGILLHAAGFNTFLTALVSLMVFSGGAQFLIASMLTINSPLFSIVLMMFFLELRYALLGSSISKYLQGKSMWFTVWFAISLNDETYAVNYLKLSTDKKFTPEDALQIEHYALIVWTISTIIGSLVGSSLSINLSVVHFALTALFIYMVVMQMKSLLKVLVIVLTVGLAILFMLLMKSTLGLVVSTLLASFVGFFVEAWIRSHYKNYNKNRLLRLFKNPAGTPQGDFEEEQTE